MSEAPRTIGVLTGGRQDWGILHSTAAAIRAHPDLRLRLLVGGMHLSRRHGSTLELVREDGFVPDAELDWLGTASRLGDAGDDPPAHAQAAAALDTVGAELAKHPVDALVLVGDRFETLAAALAATIQRIPMVHLHGGEQTFGAFDDVLRHATTKLAHLHLVSHEEHARRVEALGEDRASIHVVGAPGLDAAARTDLADGAELEAELGIALERPVIVATVHPVTLDADPAATARAVVGAMDLLGRATWVITLPNVDPGAGIVRDLLLAAAKAGERRVAVDALGERRYWGLLRIADAIVGNSSSAILEAPAVDLPAVDVGDRQAGRRRESNVIAAADTPDAVAEALRRALDPTFRAGLRVRHPTLLDGRVGVRIADIIAAWRPPMPARKPPIRLDP